MCRLPSAFFIVTAMAGMAVQAAHAATEATMKIVSNGRPVAVIVLGKNATWIERHAAQELARYVEAMSGAALSITRAGAKAAEGAPGRILIGPP